MSLYRLDCTIFFSHQLIQALQIHPLDPPSVTLYSLVLELLVKLGIGLLEAVVLGEPFKTFRQQGGLSIHMLVHQSCGLVQPASGLLVPFFILRIQVNNKRNIIQVVRKNNLLSVL